MTPIPGDLQSLQSIRAFDDSYDEPRFSVVPSKRGGPARWIVGFFLGGMLLFGAIALGRKYIPGGSGTPTTPATDERTVGLLRDGERNLLDGDLDGAKEHFAKASALADKDPRVAASMAYLAVVSADIPWLRSRLIAPDDPDRDNATKGLVLAVDQAQKAAHRAHDLAPADALVTRCRIDALRLAGDRDGARRLVDAIASASGQPENALVLATLELAEDKPNWPTVIERLKAAASAEQSLGRARSMLIFALARSGDTKAAKLEFDKLAAFARPHPLTPALRAFLSRTEAAQEKAPEASEADAGADVSESIRLGNEARKKGQFAEAEQIFQGALQKKPGDPELLTALAEVTRARGNLVEATKLFDQALGTERSYVPALAGLADLKWELGDRTTAVTLYKRVLEKGGDHGPFAGKAKERILKSKTGGSADEDGRVPDDYVAPENLVGKPPDGQNTPPPSSTGSPPSVDTSDLPGYKP
jgi:tetratricopeptide (TPR) repeat protein